MAGIIPYHQDMHTLYTMLCEPSTERHAWLICKSSVELYPRKLYAEQ